MSLLLEREMNNLQDGILQLCGTVEKSVELAMRALEQQDATAARQVIEDDRVIDQMEVRIEEEGLKILALHQPVAIDLRRIIAILKINNDLERIGDYAVSIAKRQLEIREFITYPDEFRFDAMVQQVNRQLHASVDALVKLDKTLAREVIGGDKAIDNMNRQIVERAEATLAKDATLAPLMLQIFSVSRSLERIGDHAVNIAEDVLYLITGEIVRHEQKIKQTASG